MHREAMDDKDEGCGDDGADLIGGCVFLPFFVVGTQVACIAKLLYITTPVN